MKRLEKKKWQPTKAKFSLYGSAAALYLTFFLDIFGIAVVLPIFAGLLLNPNFGLLLHGTSLPIRSLLLGFLIAATPLAQFLTSHIYIHLAQAHQRKILLLVSQLSTILGWMVGLYALHLNSYLLLILSRFWVGISSGNYVLTFAPPCSEEKNPKFCQKYHGRLAKLSATSFIVAVCIGGFLTDRNLNTEFTNKNAFWITIALAILTFIVTLALFPAKEPLKERSVYKEFSWGKIFKRRLNKTISSVFFINFAFFMGYIPFLQFFSYFAHIALGESKIYIALMLASFSISYLIGLYLVGNIAIKYIPKRIILLVCFILMICSSLLINFLRTIEIATIFHITIAFLGGVSFKTITSFISLSCSKQQTEILSYTEALAIAAAFIAPIICGFIIMYNTYAIYYFIAFWFVCGLITSLFSKNLQCKLK